MIFRVWECHFAYCTCLWLITHLRRPLVCYLLLIESYCKHLYLPRKYIIKIFFINYLEYWQWLYVSYTNNKCVTKQRKLGSIVNTIKTTFALPLAVFKGLSFLGRQLYLIEYWTINIKSTILIVNSMAWIKYSI